MDEAISIAKELKDVNALALAVRWATGLACAERNLAEVDRLASDLMELSVRYNFSRWLAIGAIYRGRARSASGNTAEGIALIEHGIDDIRATGAVLGLPSHLARKAEALHLADRTSEALEAISEAQALAERFEHRNVLSGIHRLRGVLLPQHPKSRDLLSYNDAISKINPWLVSVEAKRFSAHCLIMPSLVGKEYDFGP
jgi:hypothetical protein